MEKDYRLALVTCPNMTVARNLATLALQQKLAACANIAPKLESHYWWNGQIETSSEVLMVFKTVAAHLQELEKVIIKNHPYDTPEFIVVDIAQGNERYLSWITSSVKKPE